MNIKNRKELRRQAAAALADNPGDPKQTSLIFALVTAGSLLFVSILSILLTVRISQTGGLGGLALRSTLTTIRQAAPLILLIGLLCLNLSRQGVAMKMARRVSVQPRTLLEGFARIGAMIRLLALYYLIISILHSFCEVLGNALYMLSPFSADVIQSFFPYANQILGGVSFETLMQDAEFVELIVDYSRKAAPVGWALTALVALILSYRVRMVGYCLMDDPNSGVLASVISSNRMTRGHRFSLFLLDLGCWWFYLGLALCGVMLYGADILEYLKVSLPWDPVAVDCICHVMGCGAAGLLLHVSLNRIQTTFALAYDSLRPKTETPKNTVILGNIFDLAKQYKEDQ